MFEQTKSDLTSASESYLEVGRKAVKSSLVEFMAAPPEVEAVRWSGGVPSFNDGDPCVYRMNEVKVKLGAVPESNSVASDDADDAEEDEDDWDDEDEDEDGFMDTYDLPDGDEYKLLKADMDALYKVLELAEDAVTDLFGEDHTVTIGRDGEATVEEYDPN